MTHHDTFGWCQCHSVLVRKMKLTAKKHINMIPSSLLAFCWLTSKLSWFYWHVYRLSSKLFRLFGWTSCMQMEVSWHGGTPKSSTLILPFKPTILGIRHLWNPPYGTLMILNILLKPLITIKNPSYIFISHFRKPPNHVTALAHPEPRGTIRCMVLQRPRRFWTRAPCAWEVHAMASLRPRYLFGPFCVIVSLGLL